MSASLSPLVPEKALKTARRLFKRKGREVLIWLDNRSTAPAYTICADGDATAPLGTITTETFEWLRNGGYVGEHSTLVSAQGLRVYEFRKNAVMGDE